jgi:hypothetical protein
LEFADLVDPDDVGVLEAGGGKHLGTEPPQRLSPRLAGVQHHLQGHRPPQGRLASQVHHTHAAAT